MAWLSRRWRRQGVTFTLKRPRIVAWEWWSYGKFTDPRLPGEVLARGYRESA